MRLRPQLTLLAALPLLVTACEQGPICTTDARSSVQVTLVDPDDAPIVDAVVRYTVDGVASDCESFDGSWVCGWEVSGELSISVEAEGYEPLTEVVIVEADECHVITEQIELTLDPQDCTAEEVPAILVTVTDVQGQDVEDADVMWDIPDADMAPQPCESFGDSGNTWACAFELYGELGVSVSADPYEDYYEIVEVEHDGCHPVTESLSAVLSYLPD